MERLTERDEFGNADIIALSDVMPELYAELSFSETNALTDALNKLADYEDAEENGLLVHLPCKVGDTVYAIPSETNYRLNIANGYPANNRVYKQRVNRIEFFENNVFLLTTCDGTQAHHSAFFNNTWFLSEKEAEQALKARADNG